MTLRELVDKYGVTDVARACGLSEGYIKKCLTPKATSNVSRVKLVNAAKKLNS